MARATQPKKPRLTGCNVVLDAAGKTRVWSFGKPDAPPAATLEAAQDQPLPSKLVGKGWDQLLRPTLNIAWLADQPVFLQLVNLPTDDPKEIPSMLELQIEKLSPLPVAQVVWAWESLAAGGATGTPVLLLVAERSGVEGLLGRLERRGFDTDRVESPLVQWVAGTRFDEDGPYVFSSRMGGRRNHLIGWAKGGTLCCLNVVHAAEGAEGARQLVPELNRMAWAGEVEGWAGSLDRVRLIAEAAEGEELRAALEAGLGVPVKLVPAVGEGEIARAAVTRTLRGEERANLLPAEFGTRYRQQFTDRLWMGGLMAVLGTYLIGVLIYFLVVEVLKFQQGRLADVVAGLNREYTDTLRIKAQAQVMQETVNLRFAALDCWLATVESMPEEMVLEKMAFSGGQSLQIEGLVPADQEGRITDYWKALREKVIGNRKVFAEVNLRPTAQRMVMGQPMIQWSFNCRLQRSEI